MLAAWIPGTRYELFEAGHAFTYRTHAWPLITDFLIGAQLHPVVEGSSDA